MFHWRLGLYGALFILIALGFYWRMSSEIPSQESSLVDHGAESSRTVSGSDSEARSSGGSPALESRAARRVTTDMDAGHGLILTATDRSTLTPIPGVEVRLFKIDAQGREMEYGQASTDARGDVRFDPPAGSYVVEAHHPRYVDLRESLDLTGSEAVRRRLSLVRAMALAGLVTDQGGRPTPGATIDFSASVGAGAKTASSAADGSFRIWLSPGRYDVAAFDEGSETIMHGLEIWPGKEFFLEIRLGEISPSIRFSGTVEANAGTVPEAIVKVLSEIRADQRRSPSTHQIGFYHSAATGTDGSFSLKLPPTANPLVEITAPGHETWRERIDLKKSSTKVFRLQPERRFHLKVVDADGKVVPGVEIIGVNSFGRRVVQAKGRFVFSASEYPFEIYAVDRGSGAPISERKRIDVYQPEIRLDSPSR